MNRGQTALNAAQRVVEDYLAVNTAQRPEQVLDDEILAWLARVIGHDLHLYRGENLVASSRRDLFAAHIEAQRLPGDVYSSIVLGGLQLFRATRESGPSQYIEIYSPIHLAPGQNYTLALPFIVQGRQIEAEVNEHIWASLPVETREMKYKDAIAAGAMAFFADKYGDVVRVVDVPGVSLELCGGTHVGTTGQIALFRFTHETGAAAGVRRIEALTGPAAYRYALDLQSRLSEASALLKTQPEHLAKRIEAMLEENRKLERRIGELLRQGAGGGAQGAVEKIGDVELHIAESPLDDRAQIAALMDGFREKHEPSPSAARNRSAVHRGRQARHSCGGHEQPGRAGHKGGRHRQRHCGDNGWQRRRTRAVRIGWCW